MAAVNVASKPFVVGGFLQFVRHKGKSSRAYLLSMMMHAFRQFIGSGLLGSSVQCDQWGSRNSSSRGSHVTGCALRLSLVVACHVSIRLSHVYVGTSGRLPHFASVLHQLCFLFSFSSSSDRNECSSRAVTFVDSAADRVFGLEDVLRRIWENGSVVNLDTLVAPSKCRFIFEIYILSSIVCLCVFVTRMSMNVSSWGHLNPVVP